MKTRKWIALFLALTMAVGLLTACGGGTGTTPSTPGTSSTPSEPEETKYLKLGLTLSETLSGIRSTYKNGNMLHHRMLFTSLLEYDLDSREYINRLADKMDVSADGLVYTVTLGDHKFHDGKPITADDVVFTYTMAIRCNAGDCAKMGNLVGYQDAFNGTSETVAGIKKVDDKTVTFTLAKKDSLFVTALASSYNGILPASYFEGKTPAEVLENPEFWAKPVGSGPYMVKETNYPSYITLTRFDDYFEPAGIKDVLLTYYADTASSQAAYAAGELDYGTNFTITVANNLSAQNPDLVQVVVPSVYGRWFTVNYSGKAGNDGVSHPSLANVKVRHALDMALDKEAIASLYGDLASPLTTRINSSTADYNSDIPLWKRDVEGAKKILQEENFDFNTPIRLFSYYVDQTTTDLLDLVVQNLADVGITATYVQDKNHQNILPVTDYDLTLGGGMFPNVVETYNALTRSSKKDLLSSALPIEDPGFDAYWIPRYDDLINEWKGTNDAARQKEIVDQLQYNAYEDMPQIVLHSVDNINIHNGAHVTGIPEYARDYESVVNLKFDEWKLIG